MVTLGARYGLLPGVEPIARVAEGLVRMGTWLLGPGSVLILASMQRRIRHGAQGLLLLGSRCEGSCVTF